MDTTPVPDLVSEAMKTLNGYDAKLVIPKKTLFASDFDIKQSRLNFNVKLMKGFLSQEEQKTLSAKRSVGLRVAVLVAVHPPTKIRVIELHKREKNYSFVKGWKKLIDDNVETLKVGDSFSLWGFRTTGVEQVVCDCERDDLCDLEQGNLCFAVVPVKDSGNDDLPGETVSDLPGETVSDLPGEKESTLPAETESTLPAETESALPGEKESALPAETESALPGETKSALPAETESALPGETKSADWFNETQEFNHIPFDPNDTQGYLPGETEDFGFSKDGSIRDD